MIADLIVCVLEKLWTFSQRRFTRSFSIISRSLTFKTVIFFYDNEKIKTFRIVIITFEDKSLITFHMFEYDDCLMILR
jgi:hypothetical protein